MKSSLGKRILSIFMVAVMALSVVYSPLLADRAEASNGNPYAPSYTDKVTGIWHPGNCTYQAWEEAYLRLGIKLPAWNAAGTWCASAKNAGYTVIDYYSGAIPPANSIIEWNGHVGWCISADSNGATIRDGNIYMEGAWQKVWQQYWTWSELQEYRGTPKGFIVFGNYVGKSNLSVTAGDLDTTTIVSWTAASNAKYYNLKLYKYNGTEYVTYKNVTNLTGTSYSEKLAAGHYAASVKAVNGSVSTESNLVHFTVKNLGKSTISVSIGTPVTATKVSWTAAKNAKYYDLKLYKYNGSEYVTYKNVTNLTGTSYSEKLAAGHYAASVKAYNGSVYTESDIKHFTVKTVGATTLSVAIGDSATATKITWTAASNAKDYDLKLYKYNGTEYVTYKDVLNLTGTSYSETLAAGHYAASVKACNGSAYTESNLVHFTVKTVVVGNSVLSVVIGDSATATKITWTAASNAKEYDLKLYKYNGTEYVTYKDVLNLTGTSYSEKLAAGHYAASVKACNGSVSTESNLVHFTVNEAPECIHQWDSGTTTTSATCTATGVKTFTCAKCGKTKTESTPAKDHKWGIGETTIAATCTTTGVKTYTCKWCSEPKTEIIPAKDHKWNNGRITKLPTCVAEGVRFYTCTECKETKNESIPVASSHSWNNGKITTSPTCTEKGIITYTCKWCSETKTEDIPVVSSHIWNNGETTTAATCTTTGIKTFECIICGAKKTEAILKANHSIVKDIAVAATCTKTGLTEGEHCIKCDYKVAQQTVEKSDHNYGAYVTTEKAGFGTDGKKIATCINEGCGSTKEEVIDWAFCGLDYSTYTFNNKNKTPEVYVNDVNFNDVEYTATYPKSRKNVGKYAIKVTLTGDEYEGTDTVYFKINPKGVSISKLTKAKKSFTVKWKKPSSTYRKQMTGYQIKYSTSSKMSKPKTVTVKSTKATSKTIKKLKAKKTYYVQLRTYKTVKGVKYYSAWSKTKKIKTK